MHIKQISAKEHKHWLSEILEPEKRERSSDQTNKEEEYKYYVVYLVSIVSVHAIVYSFHTCTGDSKDVCSYFIE